MKHGNTKHQAKRSAKEIDDKKDELKMPPGALRANGSKQVSRSVMPMSRPWYVDQKFICQTCGTLKTWTATQQRWWYEVAGGEIESTAIQCRACRQKKQSINAAATARTQEHRLARAQKRALELSQKLAAQGPTAFDVLEHPLSTLRIPARTIRALTEHGYKTISDAVAHDSSIYIARLSSEGLQATRAALAELGLAMIGHPVPRPDFT
jgi:transcription elongation factor Elf1